MPAFLCSCYSLCLLFLVSKLSSWKPVLTYYHYWAGGFFLQVLASVYSNTLFSKAGREQDGSQKSNDQINEFDSYKHQILKMKINHGRCSVHASCILFSLIFRDCVVKSFSFTTCHLHSLGQVSCSLDTSVCSAIKWVWQYLLHSAHTMFLCDTGLYSNLTESWHIF